MQIIAIRTIEGPNIYSYRPVIKTTIDIGKYEDISSAEIKGFNNRLLKLLPGLYSHHCSRGRQGGFVERLHEGTYLAHIFEHVVLELQCMAGEDVNFGKTRDAGGKGRYHVVVGYRTAALVVKALYVAHNLLQAILAEQNFDIVAAVKSIKEAGAEGCFGPSTAALYEEARKRNIPVIRMGESSLLFLGYGYKRRRVWATLTDHTSALASDLACDKQLTKQILAASGIPVPDGIVVTSITEAQQALVRFGGGPVVVKPLSGNQGKGVTLHVRRAAEMERAFMLAQEYGREILIEEYIAGHEYRLCVVGGKLVAAAERIPAYVIGDGVHTVEELVRQVNANSDRGHGHEKRLTKIKIDATAVDVLFRQNLSLQAIPADKQVVRIRENANLSTGGTAVDVTDSVHPDNAKLAERAARLIGLDVAGIDIIVDNITEAIQDGHGAVIEVNAAPGIRMHHYPSGGKARNVAECIIERLFPNGDNGRIPVLAITGTNGKTTVTRMIGHIWKQAGFCVGMTTTDGIYIDQYCAMRGDTTGPASARLVLADPSVEVAVLETARGGIIRGGLAFDQCDVGIVTNITEDHLGQDGIETLEDLAFVKSLVVETVKPDGVALLNADDPFVANIAARVKSEIVYFSTEANNIVVRRHLGTGGKALFVKEETLYAASGDLAKAIMRVSDIPATLNGVAVHNLQNAVIAAAACYCMKVPIAYIRQGLSSFEVNPGRLHIQSIHDFRVCVDYGHNPAGYQAVINTVRCLNAKRLVGVIAAPGDRRDDVILDIGRIAGRGFDYLYIKEDSDLRGRQQGETAALLKQGILESGFLPENIRMIFSEKEAVRSAIMQANPGDLIVIFYEQYDGVLQVIGEYCDIKQNQELEEKQMLLPATFEHLVLADAK
ncbi:Cyanophycin synthetase [Propionispora sp. 2/2-37]|uniref:cyanophycin synthetase n=1 Tax=Propionispora sp. 2/2-37 TaxID=1677858 RepID=UPI0006BB5A0B|nr:cyanophycin synthetase [Propionispora sp. 2/2-37]CUH95464.1 Cyanophycin synthetase [Propionispora sp. 2/2-37]